MRSGALRDVDASRGKRLPPFRKVKAPHPETGPGTLVREADGRLQIGPASTHVEASSPWAHVHHRNWRERAMALVDQEATTGVHFTSPMTLSLTDADRIREMSLRFMEDVYEVVDPSPSETLYCMNLDWFKVIAKP